ncbi:MAG: signal peptidase II [Oceanococcus sp.]
MKIRFSNPYWLWLSLVTIVLDQVTKQLIINNLQWYDVVPVSNNLNITYLRNTGAAFSSFSQLPPWSFVVLGAGVSIGILVWLRRHLFGQQLVAVAMCLILGGALGNVIDRIRHGFVVDFVDVHIGQWHYAAFNVADMAISAGAALLILDMLLDWKRSRSVAAGGKNAN